MTRTYGKLPYNVVLLHGGPGAAGEMQPVAIRLSDQFGILEPFQSADSVNGQIEELKQVLDSMAETPVILIGFSWGAMLAYMFTGIYPEYVDKLVLIGSGVFEDEYAQSIMPTRMERLSNSDKSLLDSLFKQLQDPEVNDKESIFNQLGSIISKADYFDPIHDDTIVHSDSRIYNSVWPEVAELRKSGKFLAMGKSITCPVVAIHGDYDPHPIEGIRKPLESTVSDFRLIELRNCGHKPWIERQAKDEFYRQLIHEISDK